MATKSLKEQMEALRRQYEARKAETPNTPAVAQSAAPLALFACPENEDDPNGPWELRYNGIPSEEHRGEVKALGLRWDGGLRVWGGSRDACLTAAGLFAVAHGEDAVMVAEDRGRVILAHAAAPRYRDPSRPKSAGYGRKGANAAPQGAPREAMADATLAAVERVASMLAKGMDGAKAAALVCSAMGLPASCAAQVLSLAEDL